MKKKLAIIAGHNFEEVELVGTVDVLRRAEIIVEIVSFFNEEFVVGSHGIKIIPDLAFQDFQSDTYDGIILPGGAGIDRLNEPLLDQPEMIRLVQDFATNNRLLAAICAAPEILGKAGLIKDKEVTHFPSSKLFMEGVQERTNLPTITTGNIITGRSAGTVFEFALAIVEYFEGKAKRDQIAYHQLVMQH